MPRPRLIRTTCMAILLLLLSGCFLNQDPFTEQELNRFLADARVIKAASSGVKLEHFAAHGMLPATALTRFVREEAEKRGWDADRYKYIYDRCVTYAAMLHAEHQMASGEQTLNMLKKFMGKKLPEGADFMAPVIHEQVRLLREQVNAIPVSECALLYDHADAVARVALEPHVLGAIPNVKLSSVTGRAPGS